MRSVAYQIARTIPAYSDNIVQLSVEAADLRSADVRNIWQLLYRSGIFTMQLERLLSWVFDGLDESDSPGTMVKLISDLSAQEIPIRLLLISRETQELSSAVQKLAKVIHLDTIQLEGNGHDSRRFIEQVLSDVARKASYSWYITPLNLERAEGMFCGFILQFKESTNALIRRTSRARSGNCHQGWKHFTTAWLARSQIILIAILRDLHTTFWSGPHVLGD